MATRADIPTTQPRRVPVVTDRGLRRDISKTGLLFTGVGNMIGSGWLFGALYAATIAGPASVLSWVLGAAMILLVALSFSELGTMFPVSGGVIRFPHYSFGSFSGYSAGWITWIAMAGLAPVEVLAAIQYAVPHLPWLMNEVDGGLVLSAAGTAVAVAAIFVFSVINLLGVKLFARVNNILVWLKLFVVVLVIGTLAWAAFNTDHFFGEATGGFAPHGAGPIFTALPAAGIVFSYLGFRQGIEFAGEAKNPSRAVPFAVIGSILIAAVLYIGLQIAFIGALPEAALSQGWSQLAFDNMAGPLAGLAMTLSLGWLAAVLYVDAVVSPADSGLIGASVTPRLSYSQARTGNAPAALTRLNDRGVPWVGVVVMFVIGCVYFLPFPSWSSVIGFLTTGILLSFAFGPIVVSTMRRQLPDQERPFRVPGGDLVPVLGFVCSNLIVYWTGWGTTWKLFMTVLLGYGLLGLFYLFSRDRSRIPPLHFRSGWWILPWLGGLALISYLGYYNGGLGLLGLWVGEACIAVFSVAIFALAVSQRLTSTEVAEVISRTDTEPNPE